MVVVVVVVTGGIIILDTSAEEEVCERKKKVNEVTVYLFIKGFIRFMVLMVYGLFMRNGWTR